MGKGKKGGKRMNKAQLTRDAAGILCRKTGRNAQL